MGFFRQHERLRVPQFWKGEERALVIQLERILDQLFNMKVGENDIDPKFLSNIFTQTPVILDSGDDANTALASGLYYIRQNVTNTPVDWAGMIVVNSHNSGRDIYQLMFNWKGAWVRDFSGNPPTWKAWRQLQDMYIPGESGSVETGTVCSGCITTVRYVYMSIPCPKHVPLGSVTLTSLKVLVRGVNGFVDTYTYANRDVERVGASGLTLSAYGRGGNLQVIMQKSTDMTNAIADTPVCAEVMAATFTIPR